MKKGHTVITGARDKEFAIALLKAYQIRYTVLTRKGRGLFGLLKELFEQQLAISRIIKANGIEMMLQIGGIFNAPVGKCYRIPALAFSDTENERWGNKVAFPLSKHVFSPTCFDHSVGGSWKNQIHYPGYHELAYLSPRYVSNGIRPEKRFLVRFVGWGAGHDIGERGLSDDQKIEIVKVLNENGAVHVSSEGPLPNAIREFACKIHPAEIHGFMKTCRMIVGESATMASEAACVGIPAIFISDTGRGYTTEQDKKYGLVRHYRLDEWGEILRTLRRWASKDQYGEWQKRRWNMLQEKIDVTPWMVDLIDTFPKTIEMARRGDFERYYIKCAG